MIWWDFSNFEFLVFFIFMVCCIVFVIASILTIVILHITSKKYEDMIFNERNTTRIYIINLRNNSVLFFDRNNIRKKRRSDLSSFYERFHPNDIDKVKGWIFAICMQNKNVSDYLEADMILGKNKLSTYFTILRFLKYDDKDGLLFIESNIMKYITPKNIIPKKSKIPYGIVTKEVVAKLVNEAKSSDGFLFGIRFIRLGKRIVIDNPKENYMLYSLKNEVYSFTKLPSHPRQLFEPNENDLYLLDLYLKNKEDAIQLANSILKEIKKAITINGFEESVAATISIVANSMFFHDFDTLYDRAALASIDVAEKGKEIIYYERNSLYAVRSETSRFNNQISHLINDNDAMRYMFRPIVSTQNGNAMGYFSKIKLYDSPFSNLLEAGRYAAKINRNKELIASTLKRIITKFANEVNNKKISLFTSISLFGIESFQAVLSDNKYANDINVVLVIFEEELADLLKENKNINKIYNQLSTSPFQLALQLTSNTLNLDASFYSCFDFFIFDGVLTKDIRRNNRTRLKVHMLIESLFKYKKPIIANDIEGWTSIELSIKTGINYISSETIGPSSDMLLPVDKKKCQKIAQMAEKYK